MKEYLSQIFQKAAEKLSYLKDINLTFDVPKIEAHGDLSSNAAMLLAKVLKRKPREIAEEIISNLEFDTKVVSKVEIAGAGFINFFFTPQFISEIIKEIVSKEKILTANQKNITAKKPMLNLFLQIQPDR